MMQWYYADGGKQAGPISEAEFGSLINSGKITPKTLVWHAGMASWVAYEAVSQVPVGTTVAAAVQPGSNTVGICRECGNTFPLSDMITYEGATVCASCKPTFFQRLQEGAPLPGMMLYGGFWIRFAAKFIDGIIMGVVNMIISLVSIFLVVGAASSGHAPVGFAIQMAIWAVEMAVNCAYYVFFLGKFGATPGKMACKLRVVRSDGSKITYGKALGRFFGDMLSSLTLCIGYLMVVFDDEKRALHDLICDTRVIIQQE